MEKERLNLLEASIGEQQKLIDAIYREIALRKKGYANDRVVLESLAYQLHNLYCAFEDLFRIIANHFENQISDKTAWPEVTTPCHYNLAMWTSLNAKKFLTIPI